MKRLVLSLCLVGVVFSGHTPIVIETAPPPSIKQLVEAQAVSPPLSLAMPLIPQLQSSGSEQAAFRSTVMTREDTQSLAPPRGDIQREPLQTGESSEPSVPPGPEAEKQEANWVVVMRWATVHSGPSVSAPTVRFYPVGTELQLIDHQSGWFEVLDPVTSQRGWIYEKYYLEAIRGPGQIVAALQKPATPKQNMVNARQPPPVRRAKKIGPRPVKKSQPVIASAPRHRYETVASILDRALRP
jgi:hypothetical protein